MNANATVDAIAIKIVMVKAVVKRGEKVFNAYMIVSIRFDYCCWLVGLARLGCSLSALLLSIVTNGGHRLITLCVHYTHTKQKCQVFFKFFFSLGVGAWVWARGSVGGGGGMEMGGRGMGQAGLGLSLSDGRESARAAPPTRIRIAGSGVIDRPTFRLPGSQMRAWDSTPTPPTRPVGGER